MRGKNVFKGTRKIVHNTCSEANVWKEVKIWQKKNTSMTL